MVVRACEAGIHIDLSYVVCLLSSWAVKVDAVAAAVEYAYYRLVAGYPEANSIIAGSIDLSNHLSRRQEI